jgi:transcription termination factor Rho
MSTAFTGILELDQQYGFIRTRSSDLQQTKSDPYISSAQVSEYALRPGVFLEGVAREVKGKSPQVESITTINGLSPRLWGKVTEFSRHEAISPTVPLRLESEETNISMRVMDLFCPIGKGQRGLIVSPPKAGKTMLIHQLAHAISELNPESDLLVLLIDERPEEVTDMRRTIRGEVYASSSDSARGHHVRLAKLVLEYAKRKVETGKDVVLLLDSLTRLGRAFNLHQKGSGRTLSGGVDARALEIPKRIFGAARNCEGGGSLTILATALIETNSRMDELIFQEFKGTGNMELVLDRDLANERLFPAINISLSGTRREELLFGEASGLHQKLRRSLTRLSPRDALLKVKELMERYPNNELLLSRLS